MCLSLFVMSLSPELASSDALSTSLLIPLCLLVIKDSMYAACAQGSGTYCMSMFACQALSKLVL